MTFKNKKGLRRGAVSKRTGRQINIWLPVELFPAIDQAVAMEDTDRSKFVRQAIREKLAGLGIAA